jgi:O-antigen ligase
VASFVGAGDYPKALIVLGAVGALALLVLALTQFELFVLTCLLLRSSLDAIGAGETAVSNPASLLSLFFMGAALLWLAGRAYRGDRLLSDLTPALLFFAAACILSTLTSQLRDVSLVELSRLMSIVVMAIVLERLASTPAAVRRILLAVFGSALIPVFAAGLAYLAGHPLLDRRAALADGVRRVRATFDQANGFSRYLMFLLIMGVALYPHLRKRWRLPALAGLAGLGVLEILTYTRSSWLALVVGLLVVGWYQSKKLLAVIVVVLLGVSLFVPSVVDRFTELTADNGPDTALTGSGNSLAWRFSYWTDIIGLASDNPVSGIGPHVTDVISRGEKQPHNDFLRAYVELGAIGLTAYLLMLFALGRVAARSLRDAHRGWQRGVAVGFTGCFVAFIVVSLVANVMSQSVVMWYFFAFAACAAAVGGFGRAQRARLRDRRAVVAGVGVSNN